MVVHIEFNKNQSISKDFGIIWWGGGELRGRKGKGGVEGGLFLHLKGPHQFYGF